MGPYFVGNNAHRIRSLRQEANPITAKAPEPGTYRVLYATNIPYYVNDKHVALAINAWENSEQRTAGISYWKCSPVNGEENEEGTQHIRLEFYSPDMRHELMTSFSFTLKAAGETLHPELVPEEHYDNTPYKTEEKGKPKDSKRVPVKAKRLY